MQLGAGNVDAREVAGALPWGRKKCKSQVLIHHFMELKSETGSGRGWDQW